MGGERCGAREALFGDFKLAALHRDDAQVVERLNVVGLQLEDSAIALKRTNKINNLTYILR